jgi:guanylate kinase
VEWAPFLDYLQGTPTLDLDTGNDVLLEIDVQGAAQIAALHPDALLIFVDAPSREEQRRRLEERGDPPERVEQRLERSAAEVAAARDLGMHELTNDDLDRALAELEHRIEAARKA